MEPDLDTDVDSKVGEESLIDLIKLDLVELASNEETIIPVIGHERSGLAIKYHLPENGKQLDLIAQKVEKETKDRYYRNLNTAMDTMIHCCGGLFVKPAGIDEYVMLDPQEIGSPVKFDTRLGEIIGLNGDSSSARTVLKKLFAGNEMAILSHAEKMGRWLNNTKADLEVEIWQLGN